MIINIKITRLIILDLPGIILHLYISTNSSFWYELEGNSPERLPCIWSSFSGTGWQWQCWGTPVDTGLHLLPSDSWQSSGVNSVVDNRLRAIFYLTCISILGNFALKKEMRNKFVLFNLVLVNNAFSCKAPLWKHHTPKSTGGHVTYLKFMYYFENVCCLHVNDNFLFHGQGYSIYLL